MIHTDSNIENTKAQMRKGLLEFCILQILARKKMYAPDILKTLKEANLLVVEGTIYPLLNRLKREELLDYTWSESPNGPPRKYYALTKTGKVALKNLQIAWQDLSTSINSLIK